MLTPVVEGVLLDEREDAKSTVAERTAVLYGPVGLDRVSISASRRLNKRRSLSSWTSAIARR
jgi:hypothetical protein